MNPTCKKISRFVHPVFHEKSPDPITFTMEEHQILAMTVTRMVEHGIDLLHEGVRRIITTRTREQEQQSMNTPERAGSSTLIQDHKKMIENQSSNEIDSLHEEIRKLNERLVDVSKIQKELNDEREKATTMAKKYQQYRARVVKDQDKIKELESLVKKQKM